MLAVGWDLSWGYGLAHLHMGMVAGFQVQLTQKNQAKVASPFTMALEVTWHPCSVVT